VDEDWSANWYPWMRTGVRTGIPVDEDWSANWNPWMRTGVRTGTRG